MKNLEDNVKTVLYDLDRAIKECSYTNLGNPIDSSLERLGAALYIHNSNLCDPENAELREALVKEDEFTNLEEKLLKETKDTLSYLKDTLPEESHSDKTIERVKKYEALLEKADYLRSRVVEIGSKKVLHDLEQAIKECSITNFDTLIEHELKRLGDALDIHNSNLCDPENAELREALIKEEELTNLEEDLLKRTKEILSFLKGMLAAESQSPKASERMKKYQALLKKSDYLRSKIAESESLEEEENKLNSNSDKQITFGFESKQSVSLSSAFSPPELPNNDREPNKGWCYTM